MAVVGYKRRFPSGSFSKANRSNRRGRAGRLQPVAAAGLMDSEGASRPTAEARDRPLSGRLSVVIREGFVAEITKFFHVGTSYAGFAHVIPVADI